MFRKLLYTTDHVVQLVLKDLRRIMAGWRNAERKLENFQFSMELGVPLSILGVIDGICSLIL